MADRGSVSERALWSSRRARLRPQRASIPAPSRFWLNHVVHGDQEGTQGHHDRPPSQAVGEARAPVAAVLLAMSKKADESIPAPKGADPGPHGLFPCITTLSRGPREGAIIAFLNPELAAVRLEAKGLPALWQYFAACEKRWLSPHRWRLALAPPRGRSLKARASAGNPQPQASRRQSTIRKGLPSASSATGCGELRPATPGRWVPSKLNYSEGLHILGHCRWNGFVQRACHDPRSRSNHGSDPQAALVRARALAERSRYWMALRGRRSSSPGPRRLPESRARAELGKVAKAHAAPAGRLVQNGYGGVVGALRGGGVGLVRQATVHGEDRHAAPRAESAYSPTRRPCVLRGPGLRGRT
jgi:hypothetical protein